MLPPPFPLLVDESSLRHIKDGGRIVRTPSCLPYEIVSGGWCWSSKSADNTDSTLSNAQASSMELTFQLDYSFGYRFRSGPTCTSNWFWWQSNFPRGGCSSNFDASVLVCDTVWFVLNTPVHYFITQYHSVSFSYCILYMYEFRFNNSPMITDRISEVMQAPLSVCPSLSFKPTDLWPWPATCE